MIWPLLFAKSTRFPNLMPPLTLIHFATTSRSEMMHTHTRVTGGCVKYIVLMVVDSVVGELALIFLIHRAGISTDSLEFLQIRRVSGLLGTESPGFAKMRLLKRCILRGSQVPADDTAAASCSLSNSSKTLSTKSTRMMGCLAGVLR